MFQLNLQVNCKEGMGLAKDSNEYAFIETIFFNVKRKKNIKLKEQGMQNLIIALFNAICSFYNC